jgi:hypothetical protein
LEKVSLEDLEDALTTFNKQIEIDDYLDLPSKLGIADLISRWKEKIAKLVTNSKKMIRKTKGFLKIQMI